MKELGISIRRQLNQQQYIKLFSNPVSGIACQIEPNMISFENEHSFGTKKEELNLDYLKNIRYSKSMILKALYFWEKQYNRYLELLKKAQFNPLFKSNNYDPYKENEILKLIMLVHNLPDTFLFSHRHIQEVKRKDITCKLLDKKYKDIIFNNGFRPQQGTFDPFMPVMSSTGIYFSVFANEHPYIPRQKISRVGMTEKGNVFVLHKNGA